MCVFFTEDRANHQRTFVNILLQKPKLEIMFDILSISQLKKWKLKYHQIIFGKPSYDIFVDDLAFGFKKNWQTNFKKLLK